MHRRSTARLVSTLSFPDTYITWASGVLLFGNRCNGRELSSRDRLFTHVSTSCKMSTHPRARHVSIRFHPSQRLVRTAPPAPKISVSRLGNTADGRDAGRRTQLINRGIDLPEYEYVDCLHKQLPFPGMMISCSCSSELDLGV